MPLEAETTYFNAHRAEWIEGGHAGKWAVVHGAALLGFYASVGDGYDAGYKQWGHEPFLVAQVTPSDEIKTIHRLAWT